MTVEYMRWSVYFSSIFAMWPLPKKASLYQTIKYRTTFFPVLLIVSFTLFTLTAYVFLNFEDKDIALVIDFATLYTSSLFRYAYIFFYGERFKSLLETMYTTFIFESLNSGDEKINMQYHMKIARYVCALYAAGVSMVMFHMVLTPLAAYWSTPNILIPLIFKAWLPVAFDDELTHYILLLMQCLSLLCIGTIYMVTDTFWYRSIILSIGQLHLISHSCRHLAPKVIDEKSELSEDEIKTLKLCVIQHQKVRRYTQEMEDLLYPIILIDFMHGIISVTFIMLDLVLSLKSGNWYRFASAIEYWIMSVSHFFFTDYLGNELVLKEEEVGKALYEIPWYDNLKETKYPLLMGTAASRKPNRLTVGKFYFLTLEFFVGTMRLIFSYFMVLLQLNDESN